jgi:predicted nucleotidyltransferase
MVNRTASPQSYQTYNIDRLKLVGTIVSQLEKEHNLAFAYLYGSAVEQQSVHDIDIGLYYESTDSLPTSDQMLTLAHQLSSALHIPVDVRILNHAPLSFLFHTLHGQLLTCQHPDLHATILEQTAREYLDIAPFLRQSTKDAFIA